MQRSTSNRPVEILNYIFFFVEDPRDLLQIGLSSKQFCSIVIPHHIDYRRIICTLGHVELWKRLIRHPALGSQLASLEFLLPQKRTSFTLPRSLLDDDSSADDDERTSGDNYLQLASKAMHTMPHLRRFRIQNCTSSDALGIFPTLQARCKELQVLEIAYDPPDGESTFALAISPLLNLSNLTRFSFTWYNRTWAAPLTFTIHIEAIINMLVIGCPSLEDLQILSPNLHVGSVLMSFSAARWSRLERLAVDRLSLFEDAHLFFGQHQNLKRLGMSGDSSLDVADLPNLRFLDLQTAPTPELLRCLSMSPDAALNIHGLTLSIPYESDDDQRFDVMSQLLAGLPNLRTLVVDDNLSDGMEEGFHNFLVTTAVPQIQKLCLRYKQDTCKEDVKNVCRSLSRLGALTHLSYHNQGPTMSIREWDSDRPDIPEAVHNLLAQVASAVPSLEFMEVQDSAWFAITRNDDGSYDGCCRTKRRLSLSYTDWED